MTARTFLITLLSLVALASSVTAQPRTQLPTRIPQTDASLLQIPGSSPGYPPSGTYPAPNYVQPPPNYGAPPSTFSPNAGSFDAYSASQPSVSSPYGPSYGNPAGVTRAPPPVSQGSPYAGAPAQYGSPYTQPSYPPYNPAPTYGAPYGQPYGGAAPPYSPYYSPTGPNSLYPEGTFQPPNMPQFQYSNEWTKLLQRISFTHTWIHGGDGANDVGVNDSEVSASFDVPLFNFPDHFLITPGFALHMWDGPVNTGPGSADLPAQTYDAYIDTAWAPKFNNFLSADLGVRVGVYTDFDHFATDSIRVLGRGLGVVNIQPNLQFKLGVLYLDRNDIKLLPAGGLIWDPSPDQHWEIFFPKPKLARRLSTINNHNLWMYVTGEYGGGAWTIVRDAGYTDDFDYNDTRISFGLEWLPESKTDWTAFVEVGYVFKRELFYVSQVPPNGLDLTDTFLIRAGVSF